MSEIDLSTMRHSAAHVMAAAIQKLYPEAKFDIGPSTEDGFYYDVDLPKRLVPEDDVGDVFVAALVLYERGSPAAPVDDVAHDVVHANPQPLDIGKRRHPFGKRQDDCGAALRIERDFRGGERRIILGRPRPRIGNLEIPRDSGKAVAPHRFGKEREPDGIVGKRLREENAQLVRPYRREGKREIRRRHIDGAERLRSAAVRLHKPVSREVGYERIRRRHRSGRVRHDKRRPARKLGVRRIERNADVQPVVGRFRSDVVREILRIDVREKAALDHLLYPASELLLRASPENGVGERAFRAVEA